MPMNIQQLPFMAQLAYMASTNPEQFATLAASKGIPVPQDAGPGGGAGAPGGVGDLLAGNVQPQIAAPAPAPGALDFGLGAGAPQVNMPVMPGEHGGLPAPTPQTAADDPFAGLTKALAGLQQPEAPQVPQAPLAPATAVASARGGPDPRLTALVQSLLSPQGQPAAIPSLGEIVGGAGRRFT